jgi:hypothetical protein
MIDRREAYPIPHSSHRPGIISLNGSEKYLLTATKLTVKCSDIYEIYETRGAALDSQFGLLSNIALPLEISRKEESLPLCESSNEANRSPPFRWRLRFSCSTHRTHESTRGILPWPKNVGILLSYQNEFCANVRAIGLTNFEILSQRIHRIDRSALLTIGQNFENWPLMLDNIAMLTPYAGQTSWFQSISAAPKSR